MEKIETIEDLQPYLKFELDGLPSLFKGDSSVQQQVLDSVEAIMGKDVSVDLPVVVEDNWKIVLNVRSEVPATRPEMHRDWHDVSLYLTGSNNITVGEEMAGAEEKEPGNGEWRGGEILRPQIIDLKPGDLLLVPAGMPHENSLAPKTAFLVLKAKKGSEADSPVADVIEDWTILEHKQKHIEDLSFQGERAWKMQ